MADRLLTCLLGCRNASVSLLMHDDIKVEIVADTLGMATPDLGLRAVFGSESGAPGSAALSMLRDSRIV